MSPTIAILGATGKLGGATLSALLSHNLVSPPSSIVALTSSAQGSEKWGSLESKGVQVRHATFEDPASLEAALRGVSTFFLVSTPNIALDFVGEDDDGKPVALGPGREAHHRHAIDAAVRAGVERVVYSSLAFAFGGEGEGAKGENESKAGVMRAHLRTEAYLREVLESSGRGGGALKEVVAIREGLYSESWPLYLGYFSATGADDRTTVKLAGDGKICWTAISDLGVASALVLVAPMGAYEGYRSFYLSTRPATAKSMQEVAALVAEARGKEVNVEVVGREEHVKYYVQERGLQGPAVRWWVGTYEALEDGECLVDDPMLEELLAKVEVKPTPFEDTLREMVRGSS